MENLAKKLAIASGMSLMLMAASAQAGTLNGNIAVNLNVDQGCLILDTINAGGINQFGILSFGTTSMINQNIDAQTISLGVVPGLLILTCTLGTNYTVALDDGLNASGTQRRMSNGTDFVNYNLFQDAARTQPWNTTNTKSGTISLLNLNVDLTVYGRVPAAAQSVSAGVYTDTVVMTISW